MTDGEMVILLHDMARKLEQRDEILGGELRAIADRLSELSEKVKKS